MEFLPKKSKYRDIVESHMQNRLPQEGLHSSFECLTNEAAPDERSPPPVFLHTDPKRPKIVLPDDEESDLTGDDGDPPRSLLRDHPLVDLSADNP